jgi:hypothetical protein
MGCRATGAQAPVQNHDKIGFVSWLARKPVSAAPAVVSQSWRDKPGLQMLYERMVSQVSCTTIAGAAVTRCRAMAHGTASLRLETDISFFRFLLPSHFDAPAHNTTNHMHSSKRIRPHMLCNKHSSIESASSSIV